VQQERHRNEQQMSVNTHKARICTVSRIKHELRTMFKDQMEQARSKFREEQRRFQELIEDDGQLENQIAQLYKRF
jgi:hypothetical protein